MISPPTSLANWLPASFAVALAGFLERRVGEDLAGSSCGGAEALLDEADAGALRADSLRCKFMHGRREVERRERDVSSAHSRVSAICLRSMG